MDRKETLLPSVFIYSHSKVLKPHLYHNANGSDKPLHTTHTFFFVFKVKFTFVQYKHERKLYALPSQDAGTTITVSREIMIIIIIIIIRRIKVQDPQSKTFVQYQRLVLTYREKGR